MRIVIDTNLLVSGIVFLGLPAQLVDAARTGQFELCTSEHLLAESHPLQPPNGIHPLRVHSQGVRQMEAVIDRQAADELAGHFAAISKLVPLRPIRAEADYEAAVASLNLDSSVTRSVR